MEETLQGKRKKEEKKQYQRIAIKKCRNRDYETIRHFLNQEIYIKNSELDSSELLYWELEEALEKIRI